jgi:polyhydroxybutyrate depolymerase
LCALAACTSAARPSPLVQARPYDLHVPAHYDATRATPLVVLLHGYADTGTWQDGYFRISELADRETFLVATPEGTKDAAGHRFWSATDACCDFGGTGVDDVAYLGAVIDDVERRYHVDPKRVYVIGHSNGGFMAHRLACELAPRIAAIAVQAGAQWHDASRCRPAAKVSVLAIHGDADEVVHYDGGTLDDNVLDSFAAFGLVVPAKRVPGERAYPSAHQSVATWAALDGCKSATTRAFVLESSPTDVETYTCDGAAVELWTMRGAGHMPELAKPPAAPQFAEAVYAFLRAHPRP